MRAAVAAPLALLVSCGVGLSGDPMHDGTGGTGYTGQGGAWSDGGSASGGASGGLAGTTASKPGASSRGSTAGAAGAGGADIEEPVPRPIAGSATGDQGSPPAGTASQAGQGGSLAEPEGEPLGGAGGALGEPLGGAVGEPLGGAGGALGADGHAGAAGERSAGTAGGGASQPLCDASLPFMPPTLIPGLEREDLAFVQLSPDELTLYGARREAGDWDLVVASRESLDAPFGEPQRIPELNSVFVDGSPSVSADGLEVFFETHRAEGRYQIYTSKRGSETEPFLPPWSLDAINSEGAHAGEAAPYLLPAGQALYYVSYRSGTGDLYRAERSNGDFAEGIPVPFVNSSAYEAFPVVSPDELVMYFSSQRRDGGAHGHHDIWLARRASRTEQFGSLMNVSELNSNREDVPNWLSPDLCRLYFQRADAEGQRWAYVARRSAAEP